MKSKLAIIGLMICSVLAVSVSAQKLTTVVLQDDKTGDHLIFVIPTGEYKVEACNENVAIGGIGKVSVTGCKVTLQDFSETQRVVAEVDLCDSVGKADIVVANNVLISTSDAPAIEVVLSDSNTRDSAFECTLKQPEVTRP